MEMYNFLRSNYFTTYLLVAIIDAYDTFALINFTDLKKRDEFYRKFELINRVECERFEKPI